jgi:PAS domain S-box-containing protein
MSKKNNTEPAAVQGARVVANLKWLSLVIFIAAELGMSVTGIIYLALGDISLGVFLTAFLVSTVVILALIVAAYFYARRVWLGFSTGQAELVEKTTESRERYQALFESSADGIVYTDAEGRIIECNQAFADMLRYSRAELYGMTYREITPTDWHHVDDDIMESQMKESGYSDEYMKEYLMRNGRRLPVSVRSWVDYEYSGGTAGAWAVARNMSERIQYENFMRDTLIRLEQANERLQELDRLKTDLVAMVSHELRAPLGTIESSLNAMRSLQPGGSPEERDELMTILGRGVRRLTDVVDELMDITRIESGQLKLEPAPVNAFEVAERVVKSFKDLSMEKGIDVVLEHSAGRCPGTLDPHRIEQVLTNLVDNALKFSGKGPVVVRVERTPGNTVFSVEDSGPGIPPELHQKVFEKFFSLDVQSCEGKQGIGLGLAISRGIVEAHGGRIWVESHKGEGTTFVFEIPQET